MSSIVEQPILRKGGMFVLIILFAAVPALSTDLYIPCLPTMTEELHTTNGLVGLTLSVFFISMTVGMLFLGSLTDRVGRKPVLMACCAIAACLCIGGAVSNNVILTIVLRGLQGVVSGGLVVISVALTKDCFDGEILGKIIALTTAISLIAPVVAPVIGTAILQFASWRGTFVALAILFIIALIGCILMKEPLPKEDRTGKSMASTLGETFVFFKDFKCMMLILISALFGFSFMAYINGASFIIVDDFGKTEVQFTIYFIISSVIAVLGALTYMRMTAVKPRIVFPVLLAVGVISTIVILFFGKVSAGIFIAGFCLWMYVNNFVRPMATNLVLQDIEPNRAGAASSFINVILTVFCGCGMILISVGVSDYIGGLGIMMAVNVVLAIILWLVSNRRIFPKGE